MFGEKLKKLRSTANLTQLELSHLLKVTDVTISNFERGARKPDPEMLVSISEIFNVTIEYLLKDSADPEQQIDYRLINALTVAEPWTDGEVEHLVYYIEALKALKSAGIRR